MLPSIRTRETKHAVDSSSIAMLSEAFDTRKGGSMDSPRPYGCPYGMVSRFFLSGHVAKGIYDNEPGLCINTGPLHCVLMSIMSHKYKVFSKGCTCYGLDT